MGDCSFSDVVLALIERKMNLMITEIFQLKCDFDAKDRKKLVLIILREIAKGDIISCHIHKSEASKMLGLLAELQVNTETNAANRVPVIHKPFDHA